MAFDGPPRSARRLGLADGSTVRIATATRASAARHVVARECTGGEACADVGGREGTEGRDALLPIPSGELSVNTPASWKLAKPYACAGNVGGISCRNVALCTDWTFTKSKIWEKKVSTRPRRAMPWERTLNYVRLGMAPH